MEDQEHEFKFTRTKDGKYAAIEVLTQPMSVLDIENYKKNLQVEIDQLTQKSDDLLRGVKARNKMMLNIKLLERHIEKDTEAWAKDQQKQVKKAMGA